MVKFELRNISIAIFSILFGLSLVIWGILSLRFPLLIPGEFWPIIVGSIFIIGGLSEIFSGIIIKRKVLKSLTSHKEINIKQLSKEINVDTGDIRYILDDFNKDGTLHTNFDSKSGVILIFDSEDEKPEIEMDPNKLGFCGYCGAKISNGIKHCTKCGSPLKK